MRPLAVSLNVIFVRRSHDDRCQLFSTIARSCIGQVFLRSDVTLPPRTGGAEKTPRAEINLAPSRGKMPSKPPGPAFWRPLRKSTRERIKMTSKHNLYLGIHSPRTLRTRSAVFLAPNPLQDVRPVEVALTADEQEIAEQSLTTANLGRIRKAYVDRSGRCGTASMPSVRHLSKRTIGVLQ